MKRKLLLLKHKLIPCCYQDQELTIRKSQLRNFCLAMIREEMDNIEYTRLRPYY